MKKRIAVLTDDDYLYQKIYLILKNHAEVFRAGSNNESASDIILSDRPLSAVDQRAVLMSRNDNAELPIPFDEEQLLSLIFNDAVRSDAIKMNGKQVYFKGEKIKLTELEHSLLSALVDAKGSFISREVLLKSIWGDGADGGILNVYIHYLREKLEVFGEKVIISSRNQGYKIDERYLSCEEDGVC